MKLRNSFLLQALIVVVVSYNEVKVIVSSVRTKTLNILMLGERKTELLKETN